ncbi:SDR family oxidoreductase [Paractinoplanes ferrugineus]|uniref:3-oxoacyl-ACP reductase n=1 Tax=Paractinoplanes ferrugineus TaxID=113564 RepID=A0A919J4B5_9ACTN|nr:SDR family oxidoreductase [Actinoplanes ferrugineus]GIE13137.1 3-oxoacyl-ACP reductase [Actinoplanes ferrugineus]
MTGVLAGRTVLVTGALGGLGSHIVAAVAAAGARVALHHLGQPQQAAEAVETLRRQDVDALAVDADVTDWAQVEAMVAAVGRVDVLVNNAGYQKATAFVEMTLDDWRRTVEPDLTGVFLTCRHVLPGMLDRGEGVIINMSSQLAFKGAHDFVSYCAAKAGVVGLTRALAREVGPAIRVNAIAPGPVDTPFIAPDKTPDWVDARTRDLVTRRLGEAHEIAPAVVFLAGPGAALMHGQTMHLNGGGVML